jgi:T5SS/PEP-CTERM-associated repeat protein
VDVVLTTEIGSLGQINFDNGNLKTRNLGGNLEQLSGVGSINTNGLRTNLDLVFDSQHGPQQQIMVGNVAINLDANGQGDISTGHEGLGSLTIADGVTVPCRTGIVDSGKETNVTAVVTGIGSTWRYNSFMNIGPSETGTLLIENGGQVLGNSQGNSFSHVGRSGNGTVTITGNGSRWTAQRFTLAESSDGTGEIRIENGGELLLNIGIGIGTIGGSGYGKATVTGQGSKWTNSRSGPWEESGTLIIGDGGTGELTIANGGQVSNSFGEIAANFSRSTGTVTVTGNGSTWANSHDLYVGRNRFLTGSNYNGTLLVEAGGKVTSANGFIGLNANAIGTVAVTGNGSSWTNSGQISIGDGGRGMLRVSDGAVVSAANGVSVKGGGTIAGNGTILANIVNNGGSVSPGSLLGTLEVNGSYTQDAIGTMEIEIDSFAPGQFDALNVSGSANLAGALHVSLVDTIPAVGQVFTVFTSANLINNGITLRGAYARLFELDVTNSSVAIRVVNAGSPGDFNLDGMVDAADYVVWRDNSGTQLEYDAWRANFGFALASGAAVVTTVPEPAIWVSLCTAAICCWVIRLPRRILL